MKKALGMVSLDTVDVAPTRQTGRTQPAAAGDGDHVLADALASFGIENDERWAWDNYKRVVHDLCVTLKLRRILEIGGGRDPLFTCEEIKDLGVDMTVNDISPEELAILPAEYRTACFDVAGDISCIGHLRNSFDLAFSQMVFEHVADGRRAWSNLYQLLAPGGVALAFFPTLYAMPFVLNKLLPDKLAASIVRTFFPNRATEEDPVFPARYSWTFADDRRMRPMLSAIGYREVAILPFYGHGYYGGFPVICDLHKWYTRLARKHDWRLQASFAYVAVRK
jgi:SAM-dependent methyltransferase